ncbi:ABC-F family ATP-binding cassette domain-containing protein [Enteractinococcus fodinae]|uniref:Macrolide transport system ATP-binding/permease protein n=1 Tax=Enteractinococcus fodinae TaxID=684663 RepID=A0ABU2B3A0_9MICC|nr:ABC-F family ATP-binding cassette domain-containing protein [Enteractinococcus fodinae]MDR7348074.1 macrolide transport system ATP-binding/permease protein [Enteractinococcus fodinae]
MSSETIYPALSRAQITLRGVDVTFGTTPVLQQVDLTVTPTSRIAVVGENGRGKTTLLHVLTGQLTPDAGSVIRHGTIGVAEQDMAIDDNRTVGDAVAATIAPAVTALTEFEEASLALADSRPGADKRFTLALERAEALGAWDAERRVQLALEALDAETDYAVVLSTLSVGQRYRVRLACLLGGSYDFLLLDEPTNHLDRSGLEFLTQSLRERNGGVVVVSHDRALLSDVAEAILSLDPTPDGRPRLYGDGYAGYRARAEAERIRWEQEYAQQQTQHAQLQQDLQAAQDRLVTGWRPPKGSGKHRRSTRAASTVHNVQRRQASLEAHALSIPEPPLVLNFPQLPCEHGTTLLTADDISVGERLRGPVSLEVSGGNRLVVTGPNGAGKSTLLQVLAGQLAPNTGVVTGHADARIGYLQQESSLPANQLVSEVYETHVQRLISRGILAPDQSMALSELGLLRTEQFGLRVGELSMGQQRRLELALVLARRPNVLLLDEPTNHLSLQLVEELTAALETTEAAVVLATHDRQLLRDTQQWAAINL